MYVLLSLGSASAVANVVAGIILAYMRALKVGDGVNISDPNPFPASRPRNA